MFPCRCQPPTHSPPQDCPLWYQNQLPDPNRAPSVDPVSAPPLCVASAAVDAAARTNIAIAMTIAFRGPMSSLLHGVAGCHGTNVHGLGVAPSSAPGTLGRN